VGALAASPAAPGPISPLRVDATVPHPGDGTVWEYSVLVEIRDEKGAVLARRVVGVGAIDPGESRGVTVRIDMHSPGQSAPATPSDRPAKTD
jgi:hypothetical protein